MNLDPYVLETLMRDLVGHDRSPAAFIVYLHVAHQAEKARKHAAALSLQSIAHRTGLSKSAVQAAVRLLKRRKLVRVTKSSPTAVPVYELMRPWAER